MIFNKLKKPQSGNAVSVGKDAVTLTASKVITALIGLVASMLLARFRTLNEYGTYSQIIMAADLVSTLFLLGLPNSINYFLSRAENNEERKHFLSVYLTLSTILTFILGGILILATPLIIRYFDNDYISTFAYVFAVYPWSSLLINSISNTCIVYGRTNKLILFNLTYSLVTFLILLFSKIFLLNFQTYMILYMVSLGGFALFVYGWSNRMSGGLRVKLDFKLISTILVFSIPLGLASVLGTLNTELDKLIIGNFFTTEEYAIYANAARELPVTMLAASLSAVLLPYMVHLLKKNKYAEAVNAWGYAINLSFCVMCLIVGGFCTFAEDIMSLFYSAKYVTPGGIAVFRIYTLILLLRCTYFGLILNSLGQTKRIFWSSAGALVLNAVFNVACYYLFGFIGPAIASLVVVISLDAFQLILTCKAIHVKFTHIFPWKAMGILLLQTGILTVVFTLLKNLFLFQRSSAMSIINSVFLGFVWSGIYVGFNLKFITKNWRLLKNCKGVLANHE